MAAAHQQTPSPAGRERRAVRYVCAEKSPYTADLATTRAEEEGHTCVPAHHLTILGTVTGPSGAPGPLHRRGRQRVHAPARNAATDTAIVHRAAGDLAGHGVQTRCTGAPPADSGERR